MRRAWSRSSWLLRIALGLLGLCFSLASVTASSAGCNGSVRCIMQLQLADEGLLPPDPGWYYRNDLEELEPTMEPTLDPTLEPTLEPTLDPTLEPTLEPTLDPTLEPTWEVRGRRGVGGSYLPLGFS